MVRVFLLRMDLLVNVAAEGTRLPCSMLPGHGAALRARSKTVLVVEPGKGFCAPTGSSARRPVRTAVRGLRSRLVARR